VAIVFSCPACGTEHSAPENLAGRAVRCPQCSQAVRVPQIARPPTAWKGTPEVAGERGDASPAGGLPPRTGAAEDAAASRAEDQDTSVTWPEKRPLEEADMDMTPMVDVVFQLLIFFMVTAAFTLQKSMQIPKPPQDEQTTQVVMKNPENDPEYVVVTVDEFNTYRVVGEAIAADDEEAPSEQELLRKMREARNGGPSGIIPNKLLVKAHGEALHEKVVFALDAGTEVGMEQVQLMTVEETQ
jgi:biopolymer transport protein ExbD